MGFAEQEGRREVAALAARFVAEGGLDYASAKNKAARAVFGGRAPRGAMPDNDEIDEALREHLELFDEAHGERVERMRRVALELMDRLAEFTPMVTGAVWKGVAAEHAPIHLQLFHDNAKEVEYWLLDRRIAFEVGTVPHFRGQTEVEALMLEWRGEPVLLSVYGHDDLRGAVRAGAGGAQRGSRAALAERLESSS